MTSLETPALSSMAAALRAAAADRPDHPALRSGDDLIPLADLDRRVDVAAAALSAAGVGRGDRVALMLGNTPSFVVALLGAMRCGAAVVPINTGLTSPEVSHQLTDCGAAAMVVGRAWTGVVAALRGTLPDLGSVFVADTHVDVSGEGMASWDQALAQADVAATAEGGREDHAPAPDDVALLAYTSGTTGAPKAAVLTHGNLMANQQQMVEAGAGLRPDDVVMTALPLFHSYALNVALGMCLREGATLELLERFEPASALETVVRRRVTVLVGAPPMYVAWLNTPGADEMDLSSVRLATSGAAPLPEKVVRRCAEDLSLDVREGYGLAEAGPVVTSSAHLPQAVPGAVGTPLPGVELRIMDDAAEAAVGDPGLIQVRGPGVFAGYFNAPRETAMVLDDEGWLNTGDIGLVGDDGLLRLVDRAKDVIIVSGFNVYPHEVEAALAAHPSVRQAGVIGVPHPYTGEAVKAVVVLAQGAVATADELLEHCRGRLARFKQPYTIVFADELPTLPTGKVRRRLLRDAHG